MSGTSMDGIDIAMLETDGKDRIRRGPAGFQPYRAKESDRIRKALEDAAGCRRREDRPGCLSEVEELVTDRHVDAVRKFLSDNGLEPSGIDCIGFHGQTVLHRPDEGFTMQLGNGERLARETGIDCIYDMRANDMVHGGQGAPLVPVYHQALSRNLPDEYQGKLAAFVNIGGISNISFVGEPLLAFDCGPGNALIDQWVQAHVGIPYDDGGMIASEGAVNQLLAERYRAHPFFEQPLPKSLDRNDFLPPNVSEASVEDGARTLAEVTARAIVDGGRLLPEQPDLWIIAGGGRHNPHIMADLARFALSTGAQVISAEQAGFDGDAMEAECWAYLAVRSVMGLPLTFPGTTGVKHPVSGGVLARG